jgi:hypothetical protein
MTVARTTKQTVIDLPPQVGGDFQVYVNGVPQQEGRDYEVQDRTLVFERPLGQEGRLGFVRWMSMLLGVAGTYRKNDTVDVVYELDGRRQVATGLQPRSVEDR